MRGDGGGYGLAAISTIGKTMEEASKLRDLAATRNSLGELEDFLEKVEVVEDRADGARREDQKREIQDTAPEIDEGHRGPRKDQT